MKMVSAALMAAVLLGAPGLANAYATFGDTEADAPTITPYQGAFISVADGAGSFTDHFFLDIASGYAPSPFYISLIVPQALDTDASLDLVDLTNGGDLGAPAGRTTLFPGDYEFTIDVTSIGAGAYNLTVNPLLTAPTAVPGPSGVLTALAGVLGLVLLMRRRDYGVIF